MNIRKLVKPGVAGLQAYSAKDIACRVKLDANESPYGFGDALEAVKGIQTNRYPDPEARVLREIIAAGLGATPENILQGNGSDELIYYLIATFGGPVLYPVPTFSMYGIISRALGERLIEVPLDDEFDLDRKAMLRVVKKEKPKLIFLSSPNNPTGNCFSSDRILPILEASKGIVVVDEAYQPFSSDLGFAPLLHDYPNLVIMRTLSKTGLAALRFGFIAAAPDIIAEVNKVRLPFNVNALTQAVAVRALRDKKRLKNSVRAIITERGRLQKELSAIPGISLYPSEANFIFFRVSDAVRVYAELLKKGILIRNMNDTRAGCLRVTVGTPDDNSAFLRAMRAIQKQQGQEK